MVTGVQTCALPISELKLTASMLDYARQAQSGRMHWSQVSADIQYPEHPIDPSEVLANVTTAKDASAALESYNPPQKLYRELKAKLAQLRGQGNGPVIQIAEGPALVFKPATRKQAAVTPEDPRVPQLRAKLGISEDAGDARYDAKVAEAVRKFQEGAELKVTGVLDDRTVKALNSPKRDRQIDTVIVNMERWRWLPRQLGAPSLGNAYVILNIPDYTLKVMQNGAPVWTTKVVTGKPGVHATPLLTETMKFITVNPTWNVPPSIIYNEYLPALQQDPTVLERMGLRLERASDGSIHISQPPGEANALGRIRFNFPNKFLVYQHDTPDKNLFAKEERAFSHGCMRVQNPINTPRRCSTSRCRTSATRRTRSAACMATARSTSNSRRRSRSISPTRRRLWTRRASCKSARTSMAATPPCWRCSRTAEARIWKTWSHIRNRATPIRPATCRQASTLPATTAITVPGAAITVPGDHLIPGRRSSNGCSERRRRLLRSRAAGSSSGGCLPADQRYPPTRAEFTQGQDCSDEAPVAAVSSVGAAAIGRLLSVCA